MRPATLQSSCKSWRTPSVSEGVGLKTPAPSRSRFAQPTPARSHRPLARSSRLPPADEMVTSLVPSPFPSPEPPMTRINRRTFVKAAAAAPLILPRTALGDDKKDPPNSRLGVGFIGMGIQSRGHVNFCLNQKEVQVLAVCDVDTTRREAAK